MGALCPRSNVEIFHIVQNQNEIMIDPLAEIETLINQETNHRFCLSRNNSINNPSLQNRCQTFFYSQRIFRVDQYSEIIKIHKQIKNLINHKIDFQDELLEMLIDYHEFLSYVQENSASKVVTWWKEPITGVDLQQAIKHWSQQIFKFGGRLRREKAFRQLNFEPKTPKRFVKTREWIKKQREGQQDQFESNPQVEDGFREL